MNDGKFCGGADINPNEAKWRLMVTLVAYDNLQELDFRFKHGIPDQEKFGRLLLNEHRKVSLICGAGSHKLVWCTDHNPGAESWCKS